MRHSLEKLHERSDPDISLDTSKGKPISVWIAISAVSLLIGVALFHCSGAVLKVIDGGELPWLFFGWNGLIFVGAGVLLWGFVRAHRYSCKLARSLGMFCFFIHTLFLVPTLVMWPKTPDAFNYFVVGYIAVQLISSAILVISLSSRAARRYFNLECPRCLSLEVEGADEKFKWTKCRNCSQVW